MFKSRYTKLWLMLAAQLGTPVLAQPITVNTRGTGPQPVVGVTNGVPIINIAPPGTGGVKAHRDASILATGSTRIRGKITADNDVHISAGWVVNGLATIAAGNLVRLNVTNAIDNRRGSILGDSVEIVIGKPDVKSEAYSIHNEQGLIKANNLLNISADRIYNVDTRSKNMSRSSILGLVGNVVSIEGNPNTGWINNIAGSIVSGERLTVRIGEVTNAGGAISAHQLVDIKVGLFNNYFHRLASGDLINKANTSGRLFAVNVC